MALLTIGRGSSSYNYYVLRNVLTDSVLDEARTVVSRLPKQNDIYSRSATNEMHSYLDDMPQLVKVLPQLFDDVHIIGSNFFCSEPTDPDRTYHWEWHTGHSLYFGVKGGAAMTLWIPLQDLNDETGGRLKLYNGPYISHIDELLTRQVRNTGNSIANEHSILKFLNHELDANYSVENLRTGDVLLFDEMLPHQAEEPCMIHRDVLAIRLVLGDYVLDKQLIKDVLHRYETIPGECSYADEFLRNLVRHVEYHPTGTAARQQTNDVSYHARQ